jgi:hypothetical protein
VLLGFESDDFFSAAGFESEDVVADFDDSDDVDSDGFDSVDGVVEVLDPPRLSVL